ncbi:unnamed protein product, partial [Brassica oleracea var. botrytis]
MIVGVLIQDVRTENRTMRSRFLYWELTVRDQTRVYRGGTLEIAITHQAARSQFHIQ